MEEMKDYSGPFKKDLKYEDLSKEILVELLHAYGEEINMVNLYLAAEITERFGVEAMREIELAVWRKMASHELDPPRRAAKIEGNSVETYCKLNQLAGSFPNGRDFYKYEFDVINENRAILTVHDCFVPRMFEATGDLDGWDWTCQKLEEAGMQAYMAHVNPAMKVRMIRAGRKSSPDEPACKWEFWIDE